MLCQGWTDLPGAHKVNPIHWQSLPLPQVLQACATKEASQFLKIRTCIG